MPYVSQEMDVLNERMKKIPVLHSHFSSVDDTEEKNDDVLLTSLPSLVFLGAVTHKSVTGYKMLILDHCALDRSLIIVTYKRWHK